jgi:DNA modification methylase
MSKDLFGNNIIVNKTLSEKYFMPPMTVLNSREGKWQNRKRYWKSIGIISEIGRDSRKDKTETGNIKDKNYGKNFNYATVGTNQTTSIFDPVLCELMYNWFCPKNGSILDPFAGGSVRGIVANSLGYKYTGIELRQEQVDSNREQGVDILDIDNQPNWYVGDSNIELNDFTKEFDFVFSCPPYADLEVYSDLQGDISNMNYENFIKAYEEIIQKSCKLLKSSGYACFAVGEVRDKNGYYYGFVPDTVIAFRKCGMKLFNEAILLTPVGTKCLTVESGWKNNKLGKVHQNILIFKKP